MYSKTIHQEEVIFLKRRRVKFAFLQFKFMIELIKKDLGGISMHRQPHDTNHQQFYSYRQQQIV